MGVVGTVGAMVREVRAMRAQAADASSLRIYAADVVAHRLLRLPRPFRPRAGVLRTIRLDGGVEITYRRERGDIYTVREVWLDEAYRLPPSTRAETVVDLGAHIGLASVWLAKRYGATRVIAVEPSPENAALARVNLERNGVRAEVVEAAVGAADGAGHLVEGAQSNFGRLGLTGREVSVVSMPTLLERLDPGGRVDVLKVDVEGAEHALFAAEPAWLEQVGAVVAELHPGAAADVGAALERAGFRLARLAAEPTDTVCFVRHDGAG